MLSVARFLVHQGKSWLVFSVLILAMPNQPGLAQLVPDATLGSQSSTVNTVGSLDTVNGGQRVGGNLFHSFREFNVGVGRSLYFTDPGVTNILTRVTGTNLSRIDGRLGVNGTANLFLLNPNGIIFGAGASLDVRGSFTASTARAIHFADGSEFSASNPTSANLLTVSVPLGLQRGGNQLQATIVNRGSLQAGQNLTLDADHLDLQGTLQAGRDLNLLATDTVKIRDTLTTPFLAQAGGQLTIQGDRGIDILALNHLNQTPLISGGNLTLISDRPISGDTHFSSGGSITLQTTTRSAATFVSLFDPIVRASGDVTFGDYTGAALKVEAGGSIQGGNIRITSPDGGVSPSDPDYATLSSSPAVILRAGLGSVAGVNLPQSAGGTTFTAASAPLTGNLTVGQIDTSGATGNGGAITLSTSNGSIQTGNLVAWANSGNGGNVSLSAEGNIQTGNVFTHATSALPISLQSGSVSLTSTGGNLQTGTIFTSGSPDVTNIPIQGGDVTLSAPGTINPKGGIYATGTVKAGMITIASQSAFVADQIVITTDTFGSGYGGPISITAPSITLLNGAQISASTHSSGFGGAVSLNASEFVAFQGTTTTSPPFTATQIVGGIPNVPTNTYLGGYIPTGNAADAKAPPSGTRYPSGVFTQATNQSTGNGGILTIATDQLIGQDSATISATTFGSGRAGKLMIQARDVVLNNASITGGVANGASGNSGLVAISTQTLTLMNQAQIQSTTLGQGQAGDIQIDANTTVITGSMSGIISGSGTPTELGGAIGNGGNIRLTADTLQVTDSGIISTSTFTQGQGGNIDITATTVELSNQGALSATTEDQGNAGNITIHASDRVSISGSRSGLFASATPQSTGNGGNIAVSTGDLTIQEQGRITSDSQGRGTGGDIDLTAAQITLDQGYLIAETATSNGGNIRLNVNDILLLRQNSLISASAGTAQSGGNGGNITIKAGFVVASLSENSDITANAFTGNGGQVSITAQGIFGLKFQSQTTLLSDITASSRYGVSGTVTLNTPNIDPNRGSIQLPSSFTDSTNQIAQTCSTRQQRNSFVVTGRGGVSPDPNEALNQMALWQEESQQAEGMGRSRPSPSPPSPLTEATGWQRNPDGSISLVADREPVAPSIAISPCRVSQQTEER